MNQVEKISKALHLSLYEAKVYLAIQQNGPLLVKTISKYADIPRTAVYAPLTSLINRGFASKTNFGKRTYYSVVDPEYLLGSIDEQKYLLEQVIANLNKVDKIQSSKDNFETTFYSGEHGIKTAGLIFLNDTKEKVWFSFENLDLIADKIGLEFENFYIKERIKRGIKSKMILSFGNDSFVANNIIKNDKDEMRETVLLSKNQYPFQTTVVATKGMALIINPNENPFAVLIKNKYIADTFITIHRCLWERFKI